MWPTTAAVHIEIAEKYRHSRQWLDAAIEYRKAIERAKDDEARAELRIEETEMLRCEFADTRKASASPLA